MGKKISVASEDARLLDCAAMKRSSALIAFLLLTALIARGQELPVYGELSELKEARRVYVTSEHASARANIVKELKKYAGLEVVTSPEVAEFLLLHTVTSQTDDRVTSQLTAAIRTADGKQRILWQEEEARAGFGRPNSVNLTRHFIKAFKKLRGEK